VGLDAGHPASFRCYLRERLVDAVRPRAFHGVAGEAPDPEEEARRYAELIGPAAGGLDLCVCGIGENGHLAFNDPPFADFEDPELVKVVKLDGASRGQQLGEGWFGRVEDVPETAITLTIPALLSARAVVCFVPEARKAEAVRRALTGSVDESCPASVLRGARHATLYLDRDSASLVARPG
jgi:glucosamine-6-phosphate deaminase